MGTDTCQPAIFLVDDARGEIMYLGQHMCHLRESHPGKTEICGAGACQHEVTKQWHERLRRCSPIWAIN